MPFILRPPFSITFTGNLSLNVARSQGKGQGVQFKNIEYIRKLRILY